ncbi:MAG: carbohydrate kinase family protein [Patescibacteria group bacterium]
MTYDFLAIGDVVTDAFIRIPKESAEVIGTDHQKLCLEYGSKVPFERAYIVPAVGNSANAAVAASRLGLKTALVSNVGHDMQGREIIETLKKEKIDTRFIHVNADKISNYHYVLWYQDDRTILIRHEEYNYTLPAIGEPRWLYLSSAGHNSLPFHNEITAYIKAHPSIKLVLQPGTFQMKFGVDKLKELYAHTELFFCNREEAQLILETNDDDIAKLTSGVRSLGPKIVVVTDGKEGAYVLADGVLWFMPPYPDPKPPYERTGAGDAFSSTFAATLALGHSIEDAMRWAPINSMSVVQYVGAQQGLLDEQALRGFLAEAPSDYKPKRMKEL